MATRSTDTKTNAKVSRNSGQIPKNAKVVDKAGEPNLKQTGREVEKGPAGETAVMKKKRIDRECRLLQIKSAKAVMAVCKWDLKKEFENKYTGGFNDRAINQIKGDLYMGRLFAKKNENNDHWYVRLQGKYRLEYSWLSLEDHPSLTKDEVISKLFPGVSKEKRQFLHEYNVKSVLHFHEIYRSDDHNK